MCAVLRLWHNNKHQWFNSWRKGGEQSSGRLYSSQQQCGIVRRPCVAAFRVLCHNIIINESGAILYLQVLLSSSLTMQTCAMATTYKIWLRIIHFVPTDLAKAKLNSMDNKLCASMKSSLSLMIFWPTAIYNIPIPFEITLYGRLNTMHVACNEQTVVIENNEKYMWHWNPNRP